MDNRTNFTDILKYSFASIFFVLFIIICGNLTDFDFNRNSHLELLGIALPLSTFLRPIINTDNFKADKLKRIYWSKENILIQIATAAINIIGIIYIWCEGYKDSVIPDSLQKFGKNIVDFLL